MHPTAESFTITIVTFGSRHGCGLRILLRGRYFYGWMNPGQRVNLNGSYVKEYQGVQPVPETGRDTIRAEIRS